MAKYYFSDTHIAFATKKEEIIVNDDKDFAKTIKEWAKNNNAKSVFVYDENYNFIWNYNFN